MGAARVYVVRPRRRGLFVLRWREEDGRARQRTVGPRRRVAEDARRALEAQLSRRPAVDRITWPDFWALYLDQLRAAATIRHACSTRRAFEPAPQLLAQIDTPWIDARLAELRGRGLAVATRASYCRRLRAALNWAARRGYCAPISVPVESVAGAVRTRGLALEEFERMELAACQLFDRPRARAVVRLMRGAWLNGLRISELLALSWDDPTTWHVCDLDHARRLPTIVIPPGCQKSGRAEVIPATPDFAGLLRLIPYEARRGPIFAVNELGAVTAAGKKIAACGRRAGVSVDSRRYASAHDLRHSFALRWAEAGLSEAELASILRHKSVATTRQYYLRIDAQRLGERLYSLSREEPYEMETPAAAGRADRCGNAAGAAGRRQVFDRA